METHDIRTSSRFDYAAMGLAWKPDLARFRAELHRPIALMRPHVRD
jgi:hypothetical protein